ncbi:glycoside hydrolase family 5 protein [Paenibacillus sp. S150]|uniref:glycoside hydrolase family 5 protein n=1 Tax=Paenibacillus sp. S150 TaxID=2749826 RepID=UPI001C588E68|nr:cellulase family glycosylhydrolase [Paenibacillus sp. S150]MBW4084598.1 cellulase family glycosylhydrolase [Paenibacillus sp. S150]
MISVVKSRSVSVWFVCTILLVSLVMGGGNVKAEDAAETAVSPPATAKEIVSLMGRGTNLGNTFEGNWNSQSYEDVKAAMDAFIAAGYTNIRMPVNWGGRGSKYPSTADELGHFSATAPNVATVKRLVDYVLKDVNPQRKSEGKPQIILIINTHHEEWAMESVLGEPAFEANMQRLETIWTGIADLFKDEPETLLFELFNEPHLSLNTGALAKASVIELNKRAYAAIRSFTADGKQPHAYRNLIFGGYNYNSGWGLYDTYRNPQDLPGQGADRYVIGTYHSYFQNLEDHLKRVDDVKREFADVHDIPVYLGEFGYEHRGVITDTLLDSYRQIANKAIAGQFAFSVWDDNGWYQIYNRSTGQFNALKDQVLNLGN